jgi:hypothetical protein
MRPFRSKPLVSACIAFAGALVPVHETGSFFLLGFELSAGLSRRGAPLGNIAPSEFVPKDQKMRPGAPPRHVISAVRTKSQVWRCAVHKQRPLPGQTPTGGDGGDRRLEETPRREGPPGSRKKLPPLGHCFAGVCCAGAVGEDSAAQTPFARAQATPGHRNPQHR